MFAEVSRLRRCQGQLADTASLAAGYGAERRAGMQNHVAELAAAMVGGPVVSAPARYDSKQTLTTAPLVTNGPIAQLSSCSEIEVRQGARVLKRISGAQLPAQRGFAADTCTDSQGRQRLSGGLYRTGRDWAMHAQGLG